MKNKSNLAIVICLVMTFVMGSVFSIHSRNGIASPSLTSQNVDALIANRNKVTCVEDTGDICIVGATEVLDWDEYDSWFN